MQSYLNRTLYEIAHPLGYEVWVEQSKFAPGLIRAAIGFETFA